MKNPISIFLFLLLPFLAGAAPQAERWDVWTPWDENSAVRVDHSPWGKILGSYLVTDDPSGINLFFYGKVTPGDRAVLAAYIKSLEQVQVDSLDRREQMAYWINLYNALTVSVILEAWPVKSIRDINLGGGSFLSKGPWDAPAARIQGRDVTLNDIEHRILRPIWNDPRVHYAVNCASLGCPNLQPVPFTAENSNELLDAAAEAYINHPRGVLADGKNLNLSSIYDWFAADFGADEREILDHIYPYARPELRLTLDRFLREKGKIRYRYDWKVNAAL